VLSLERERMRCSGQHSGAQATDLLLQGHNLAGKNMREGHMKTGEHERTHSGELFSKDAMSRFLYS
jgi:hypothetical protein